MPDSGPHRRRSSWKQRQDALDATFNALANPTRRAIVDLLHDGDRSLTDIATPMPMSLPGVAKHIDVLERAGLIQQWHVGRQRRHSLRRQPLSDIQAWIRRYSPE